MSGRRDTPRLSRQEKRKGTEEDLSDTFGKFSPFKKHRSDDPDQSERQLPGPKPRFSYLLLGPKESEYIPKTLNSREANGISPLLCFNDTYEACVLLDCPGLIDSSPPVPYTMNFSVFDKDGNGMYNMKLAQNSIGGSIELAFDAEWGRYVKDYNLKAGDEISFDKNLDTNISDDFYYILKYVRNQSDGYHAECSKRTNDGAEGSKTPSGGAEGSKKPSDQSGLERNKPMFRVIYHQIQLANSDSQEQQNVQGPGSRDFPLEASCLSKTLTLLEAARGHLYFDLYDAIILTGCPKIAEVGPGECSVKFLIFDGEDRRYDMTLEHFMHRGGILRYVLVGCEAFLGNHVLRQGDQVTFYKFLDRNVSIGYYFVLKYVTKQPAEVDPNMRNPERSGSRALFPENHCFTKTLSLNEVVRENAGLQLDASHAGHFGSPNDLLALDASGRQYDMKLSYFVRRRGIIRALDGGWQTFVTAHNLKAGDEISVYKVLDQSVCDGCYYIIRCRIV
ncbi:hypothetical protein OROGR_027888 [Orobanche gracilis]